MKDKLGEAVDRKLAVVIELLQNLLALELAKQGVERRIIAKRLRTAKANVVRMLQGVRKDD